EHRTGIALLTNDGFLRFLENKAGNGIKPEAAEDASASWQEVSTMKASASSRSMVAAKMSGNPTDDLVLLDPSDNRVRFVSAASPRELASQPQASDQSNELRVLDAVDLDGATTVLPIRLNGDALT